MRALGFVTLLASALTVSADSRTVTKTTLLGAYSGARETVTTEYQQGENRRTESEVWNGSSPAHQRISISVGGKVIYELDPETREYTEYQIPRFSAPSPSALELPGSMTTHQSGKTLDIYLEIRDTGERKEFFGQTAEHLIWRERFVAEPGACGTSSTREMITNDGVVRTEILELSHEPLDKNLFEVPGAYTKVQNLPMLQSPPPPTWSQMFEREWAQLLRELESWFR